MGHGDGLDLSHPPASVTYDILCLTTAITGNAVGLIDIKAQELCESRGGRPGLPVLMSLTVSVDVKQH